MSLVKERMSEIIQAQSDDSTYEKILRELVFARMVERGLEDSRQGRVISNEEMEQRICLKGQLFVDYLSSIKRQRIRKKLEKAQR
jgi:predicted transcriptional regulator